MVKFKQLTIKNFLSIGAVTQAVILDNIGLSLIVGSNSDSTGEIMKNGAGKAQPLTAKVKTPFGWKQMGEMKLGDLVSTPSGRPARVDGVFPQGSIPVYKFTFGDGRTTEACADHIWKVWAKNNNTWGWQNKTTLELIEHIDGKPHNRAYVPLLENDNAPDIELPLDPRLMGIMLGDGYMTGLSFASKDQEIIDYVIENVPDEYTVSRQDNCNYRITRGKGKKGHDCRLRQVLAFYKLSKTRSNTKFIPNDYKRGSINQRLELLSGLLDTDGTVGKNGEISFTTVSEQLCNDVVELVRSIGGLAKVTTRIPKYTHGGEKKDGQLAYTIGIRYHNPRNLFRLTRKLDRISKDYQYADCLRLEIKSIENNGVKEAQCISIDDKDHLYITDDYIVTHNTTILQAISYALYGKPLTKIKIPNLINNINGKNMLVTLEFEHDGISYKIERGKKVDVMKFYKNNVEQKLETDETMGENRHTQQEIQRIIGMSHMMFKYIVALNTFTDPFFLLGSAVQRELVEELLGISQIGQRAEVLADLIKASKKNIKDQESIIAATNEANARIDVAIQQAENKKRQWDYDHDNKIHDIEEQIEATISIDFDAELRAIDNLEKYIRDEQTFKTLYSNCLREMDLMKREKQNLDSELERIVRALSSTNSAQIDRLRNDKQRRERNALSYVENANRLLEDIQKAEKDLDNADDTVCSYCEQKLTGTVHLHATKEKIKAKIEQLKKDVDTAISTSEAMAEEALSIQNEIDAMLIEEETTKNDMKVRKDQLEAECQSKNSELEIIAQKVSDAKHSLNTIGVKPDPIFDSKEEIFQIKAMKESLQRDLEEEYKATNPYIGQIEDFKQTIQDVDYETINELQDLLKHQEYLHKLLTGKDSFIRKKIIDQNLVYLNSRMNQYLEKLGLPHEVCFQSDMSVDITLLGRDFDFAQLSRGEMNRVIVATSWSFRDVWESMNQSINLMWVDELLDQGTDDVFVASALQILKGMVRDRGKNIFLISHKEEIKSRIDRIILVKKENGFTSIEADATI